MNSGCRSNCRIFARVDDQALSLSQKCACQPDCFTYKGGRASGNPPVAGCDLNYMMVGGGGRRTNPSCFQIREYSASNGEGG